MRPTETNAKKDGPRMWRGGLTAGAAGLAVCLTVLAAERPAAAQEFTLHAEPAGAFWAGEPQ